MVGTAPGGATTGEGGEAWRSSRAASRDAGATKAGKRLPPGQYLVEDFPVLSAGPTPHTSLDMWTFTVTGQVPESKSWTWEEFRALPSERFTTDIHCVTKWSKLDTVWEGVSVDTLLDGIDSDAAYVL